ncbi:glycosyltransferase [Gordonia sp. PKS22-38]|uniref:Glycosyltransferase n=1 Tax=Gordonia prachuapensis TaxID=3115651 RepID=A0ABU7MSB8_9ACTN|nr:glycosyltransferase [Gordonia sp. PKS22-38]
MPPPAAGAHGPVTPQTSATCAGSVSLCVVICCYTTERWDIASRGMDAVARQLGADDRLIVVVDHNEDLRRRLERRFDGDATPALRADQIVIADNTFANGLSGARNAGLALATEDVVVFLDDDAVARPDALSEVRAAFADDTTLAIGGGVHADWAGATPGWFPDEFGWVVGCDYRGIAADGAEIRNPIGAAMAARRAELTKIGGFDSELGRVGSVPAGCEETLMGIELGRAFPDGHILRRSAFGVDHRVPENRADLRYFLSRCRHEGQSKAVLSKLAGPSSALSAEVTFLATTVTTGIARYLGQLVRGDLTAAARLAMLLVGVAMTVLGTAVGSVTGRASKATEPATPPSDPVSVDDLVSVVIPTVGRDFLPSTVHAVLAQDHPNLQVIVVDNRPERGDARMLVSGITDARLRVVDQPHPGVSAARNAGIAAANGRVIAFTDDDAIPDIDWVTRIVQTFAADTTGTLGVVSGRVFTAGSTNEIQGWFEATGMFDKGPDPTVWSMNPAAAHQVLGDEGPTGVFFPYVAGQFGSGNNMAFTREALESIGGFDERLGTGTPSRGGEDLDSFRAAILAGWTICYRPEMIVRHHHRDTMAALRAQCYGYGTGMAASLTKVLGSRHALGVLKCMPLGLWLVFSPKSSRNEIFPDAWPRHLRVIEQLGYLAGPLLYLRTHARLRNRRRCSTPSGKP